MHSTSNIMEEINIIENGNGGVMNVKFCYLFVHRPQRSVQGLALRYEMSTISKNWLPPLVNLESRVFTPVKVKYPDYKPLANKMYLYAPFFGKRHG